MTIRLSQNRQEFVRSLVQTGQFASEEAVVEEALQLLKERFEDLDQLAELRRQVAIGIAQADRGELASFDPHATLARIRSRRIANPEHPNG